MNMRGKKVACFVALPHHTRFMLPVAQEIRKRGGQVVFFLSLGDYPFELDLLKKGQQYRFLTDYLDEKTEKNIEQTLAGFLDEWQKNCFRWDGLRQWPLYEQNRHIEAVILEYFCVQRFIEEEQPDLFLALHERNRWGKIIGHQAAAHGIPYVTFQEGDYHESRLSFSAHTEYSTVDILWGAATRETLMQHHASEDKMVLVGNTHLDEAIPLNRDNALKRKLRKEFDIPSGKKILLVLVDLEWSIMIDARVWQPFFENLPSDVFVIFKWHPNAVLSTYEKARDAIKSISPETVVVYTYNSYHLLALTDYCVTLGKTTLALESLVYGKPLFATPTRDGTKDYYLNIGVAQSVWPFGNWAALHETMKNGIPASVVGKADEYLKKSFYCLDGQATHRAVDVLACVVDGHCSLPPSPLKARNAQVPGRVSFILPSGSDTEALLATLQSLAENVALPDWETIIVISDDAGKELVDSLSGDVVVASCPDERISTLFNVGAAQASGEFLIFLKPGMIILRVDDMLALMPLGVVGMPICDQDARLIGGTYSFDFNYTPREVPPVTEGSQPAAVGGGVLAVPYAVFMRLGGFDELVANHLAEVDFCMKARSAGTGILLSNNSLAGRLHGAFGASDDDRFSPDLPAALTWRGRVRFYAKWWGKLPKSEDYLAYAGALIRI